MKKFILYITYSAAFILGILLLIFSQQALSIATPTIINILIIIIGVIFLIPGIGLLLASMRQKHDENGNPINRNWIIVLIAAIALIWGILSVSMTGILVKILPITLGITLIIAGIVQIIWMATTPKKFKQKFWWYIFPIVVIGVGLVCIIVVNSMEVIGKASALACIIAGLSLIVFSIGGYLSLKRELKEINSESASTDTESASELPSADEKEDKKPAGKEDKKSAEKPAEKDSKLA